MNSHLHKVLLFIPLFLWILLIFHFSNQTYQEQSIKPLLEKKLSEDKVKEMLPDVKIKYTSEIKAKENPFGFIEFLFRKGAHLFIYGVLALMLYLAFLPYKLSKWKEQIPLILFTVLLVASLDEWNQTGSTQRTGIYQDVIVDFSGALISLSLLSIVQYIYQKRRQISNTFNK